MKELIFLSLFQALILGNALAMDNPNELAAKDYSNQIALCKGAPVLHGDAIRIVEWVDSSDRVILMEDDDYNRTYTTNDEVTMIVPSHKGYKAGDPVLYMSDFQKYFGEPSIKIIEAVDNTGRIVLKEDDQKHRIYTTTGNITNIVRAYKGFKAGDMILYNDEFRIIELVDNSGKVVLVEDDKNNRTYTSNDKITMVKACASKP